ncbi:hypothetical protein Ahy_A03g014832 isoform G [Arachis hypogaea]|uniref:Uncharacterized protein n=1 Tax=Arachis hypogaea TaxID=3818 RepID=A0A445A3W8_ARAHY|nr:hypothetical protein Ahy_B03g066401 isoform G [Arachis hypogaea]RYR68338.1 hypothetical protein Ahy_A03g014832 isoform G [Arachis hypogaea]
MRTYFLVLVVSVEFIREHLKMGLM